MTSSDDCITCPAGTFCPTGSDNATDCAPGTFNAKEGQAKCESCPAGEY